MARVVRAQTLERGRDPREFTLVASGGAGPMHACEVAAEVGIRSVLVPPYPGHFSAIGMLAANLRRDRREVFAGPLTEGVRPRLEAALEGARQDLTAELRDSGVDDGDELTATFSLFLRQRGQDHVLSIAAPPGPGLELVPDFADWFAAAFVKEYGQRYGHRLNDDDLELAEFEVVVERPLPAPHIGPPAFVEGVEETLRSSFAGAEEPVTTRVLARSALKAGARVVGPAILVEQGATTVLPPGAVGTCLDDLSLLIDVSAVAT